MRHLSLLLALVAALVGCEVCEKDPQLCMPPAPIADDGEDAPPAPPAPATEAQAPDATLPDALPDAAIPADDGEDAPAPPTDAPAPPEENDEDQQPAAPPERQISDASTSPTWYRNGAAFAELTAMVSIEVQCVNSEGGLVFSVDTRDYGWDELDGLELIEVGVIPYGQYPTAEYCYGLLRQNEQETPDFEVPTPGDFEYPIDGMTYDAPVAAEGDYEGWWKMTLHPPAVD